MVETAAKPTAGAGNFFEVRGILDDHGQGRAETDQPLELGEQIGDPGVAATRSRFASIEGGQGMSSRGQDLKSRRFEFEEIRRKLRDLNDLKRQIEASLDRMAGPEPGVSAAAAGGGGSEDRRDTLMQSLSEINRQIKDTRSALESSREAIEHQEQVHNGYDRIPVAVGSRRGRGQVEHIRIVRNQRS